MKSILLALIFSSLLLSGNTIEITGNSLFCPANENSEANILSELRELNIIEQILGAQFKDVRAGMLSITAYENISNRAMKFRFFIETGVVEMNSLKKMAYELYVRMRINGVSSISSIQIIKCWLVDNPDQFIGFDGLPPDYCEKIFKIPASLNNIIGEEFSESVESENIYIFRDHDLCWILQKKENKCIFTIGFDGKIFNVSGFDSFLSPIVNRATLSKSGELNSLDETWRLVKNELMKNHRISFKSPNEVPLPNRF